MFNVKVHSKINFLQFLFHKLGLWHRGDVPSISEMFLKWFYSLSYLFQFIAMTLGAFTSDDTEDSVFLIQSALFVAVFSVKASYLLYKKDDILRMLNVVCVYTTSDRIGFTATNDKINLYAKCSSILVWTAFVAGFYCTIISPFVGSEWTFFFKIALPFDYENGDIGFWLAYTFLIYAFFLIMIGVMFNVLMWYIMYSCALRYKLLERQIRDMGIADNRKLSIAAKNDLYHRDLIAAINTNTSTREITGRMDMFFKPIFIASFATSGVTICCTLYSITFNRNTNFMGLFVYLVMLLFCICDILTLTYIGNEIKLSSDRFNYCLFESDWMNRPKSTRKCVIIFGEFLMHPYEIFVLKQMFPLTLETFMRILNSAYSMFNVLKNFK